MCPLPCDTILNHCSRISYDRLSEPQHALKTIWTHISSYESFILFSYLLNALEFHWARFVLLFCIRKLKSCNLPYILATSYGGSFLFLAQRLFLCLLLPLVNIDRLEDMQFCLRMSKNGHPWNIQEIVITLKFRAICIIKLPTHLIMHLSSFINVNL